MPPYPLLAKLNLLAGNKTVLDIGTKDALSIKPFIQGEFEVHAIDIKPLAQPVENLQFTQTSIEDFLQQNIQNFDIVIARHILPFTSDPLHLISEIKKMAGVFLFTCFGPEDEWRDREDITTLKKEDLTSLFKTEQIRHYSETLEYSGTYSGNTKFWHIHTLVVDLRQ